MNDAKATAIDRPDDPPPSYEDAVRGSQSPSFLSLISPTASSFASPPLHHWAPPRLRPNSTLLPPRPRIPKKFGIYLDDFRDLVLGLSAAEPLFHVDRHSGLSRQPSLTLHAGPRPESPVLAIADWFMSSTITVTLPPRGRNRGSIGSLDDVAAGEVVAVASTIASFPHVTYPYAVEVGPAQLTEGYEWRRSRGPAVQNLGSMAGHKLVRLSRAPPPGVAQQPGQSKFVVAGETTSDGYEVVAVAARAVAAGAKVGRFAFLGTGASGALGDRWAVMAMLTGVSLVEMDRQTSQRGGRPTGAGLAGRSNWGGY